MKYFWLLFIILALNSCTSTTKNITPSSETQIEPTKTLLEKETLSWHLLNDETLLDAKKHNKLIIVQIGIEGDELCDMMMSITYKNNQLIHRLNEHYIMINIDGAQFDSESFASFPATIFLTPDGEEAGRAYGMIFPSDFINIIDKINEVAKGILW